MSIILLKNCTVWDATRSEPEEGCDVVVEGDRIKDVSPSPVKLPDAREIDLAGRTLMPGLIDCHAHVNLFEVNVGLLAEAPLTLMTAHAANLMRRMIDRGFTTVRDTGGADWGIKEAVEKGLLPGPKLYISFRSESRTLHPWRRKLRLSRLEPRPTPEFASPSPSCKSLIRREI